MGVVGPFRVVRRVRARMVAGLRGGGRCLLSTAPLGYKVPMQTVIETPTFTRQADKLFSEDENAN